MKKPPFLMTSHQRAVLICDGRFVIAGKRSFVWETFLMRRTAGVPGVYAIRDGNNSSPWHQLNWSIEQAEADLGEFLGRWTQNRLAMAIRTREYRAARGLPVG